MIDDYLEKYISRIFESKIVLLLCTGFNLEDVDLFLCLTISCEIHK